MPLTSDEFQARLSKRAAAAGLPEVPAGEARQLETYFQLLSRWNAKINLTALPLLPPTDHTFDRLLIEPLLAARLLPASARTWFDLGSGGGSPAIPMKVAHPAANLTMVEIKSRKAAFLREAVRTLGLDGATVANEGFEVVADAAAQGSVDLVTIRALRCDAALFSAVGRMLTPTGLVLLFHSNTMDLAIPGGFRVEETVQLQPSGSSVLTVLRRTFHVEHGTTKATPDR